ncbi:MAG: hypothetical protein ACRDVD_07300 [Acidimicrobiia bacterium]
MRAVRHRSVAGAVVLAALAACASGDAEQAPEPDPVPPLQAACGSVGLPVADPPVLPDEPLDADADAAMAELFQVGADPAVLGPYEWFIAERTDEGLWLLGRSRAAVRPGDPAFADASFTREGSHWKPEGAGTCRIEVSAPGFSTAHWITNPTVELDTTSDRLAIQLVEAACAGGEPPEGRRIVPIVEADDEQVTIRILVEPVEGFATCAGNSWYPMIVDLGEPLGERSLSDGSVIPGLARVWPPTRSSLESMGRQP